MADEKEKLQESQGVEQRSYVAPSRRGQVSVAAYVSEDVRRELRMIALEKGTTVQRLLCIGINDLFEANSRQRLADEEERPRGGAAQKRG